MFYPSAITVWHPAEGVIYVLQAKSTCSWRPFGDKENVLNSALYPVICQKTTGLPSNKPDEYKQADLRFEYAIQQQI
ncbi:MAG: hypothetical protein ACYSUK_07610 [Planctomycetota bacterium]|jgi:hypothetical protein